MPPFQLVADYQPTGDQPQAIIELVDGLEKGLKHQTLLGATGTGKSLGFHDSILVIKKSAEGSSSQVMPIGELIDNLMGCPGVVLDHDGDTEILYTDGSYYTQAFDPATCQVVIYPIRSFVRHQTPATMYRVKTACGRSATLTGDHNLWVLRDGNLQLIRTAEARTSDYVPIPGSLPIPELSVNKVGQGFHNNNSGALLEMIEVVTLDESPQVSWIPIESVEPITYTHPHVYDFCVPGVENFLAGEGGGFFVHNTFTIAQVVEKVQKPTLVMAHNKTLAAQLYAEFKDFFPKNAVEYFVSYYDYYQPEAYVPRHDLYIEKESDINEEIERLRLSATAALMTRRDVLIVASVSCIYGLGSPVAWSQAMLTLKVGQTIRRDLILRHLVEIYYDRNDMDLKRGTFRVRGDTLEVMLAWRETAYRITMFGDDIERLTEFDPLTGELIDDYETVDIFPARYYVTDEDKKRKAILDIEKELEEQLSTFRSEGKILEAQRIEQRTRYDIEMLREVGVVSGIENYSRHLDQRAAGTPPWVLLDYFPEDFLMVLDESHMTLPQIRGMSGGDRARKSTLIDYGFRLPSAADNRPLNFEEFEKRTGQLIYTSATPGPYEAAHAQRVVQQVIRPTGIVDPAIIIKPVEGQVDDLLKEVTIRIKRGERVLVTTLTKRMAEDLAEYFTEMGIRVHYLHSEIETIQRIEILRDLRLGVYDVVIGINLLREGLDLPEVSLVAILDADKEGFLRSDQALIQTIGRAARHIDGQVIMYANRVTDSMKRAIDETDRRRAIQVAYNIEHNITPASIVKQIRDLTDRIKAQATTEKESTKAAPVQARPGDLSIKELDTMVRELEKAMKNAAKNLEFEKAAALRDQMVELKRTMALKSDNPDVALVGMFDTEN